MNRAADAQAHPAEVSLGRGSGKRRGRPRSLTAGAVQAAALRMSARGRGPRRVRSRMLRGPGGADRAEDRQRRQAQGDHQGAGEGRAGQAEGAALNAHPVGFLGVDLGIVNIKRSPPTGHDTTVAASTASGNRIASCGARGLSRSGTRSRTPSSTSYAARSTCRRAPGPGPRTVSPSGSEPQSASGRACCRTTRLRPGGSPRRDAERGRLEEPPGRIRSTSRRRRSLRPGWS
jgi:hypothetical protein